jgi:cytochrome c peroxidase
MNRFSSFFVVGCIFMLTAATVDLDNMLEYENQPTPIYITKDNSGENEITNEGALLGRVLFYDKNLSVDRSVSCSSCHIQAFAFGDTAVVSTGVNGVTGRHSMRLVNAMFGNEVRFFWDERADDLEMQTTMPIRDHIEMGFSGENGDPDFSDLIIRLNNIDYYNDLFFAAYGDTVITEERIKFALSQFVRSIQSFDAKYDLGRSQVLNDSVPFPNFTVQENLGKSLFIEDAIFDPQGQRIGGGAGCGTCHIPPEFDIDINSLNNGVIGMATEIGLDLNNTRSPTMRDLVNANGELNGPMMHTGEFNSLDEMIQHYNLMQKAANPRLDPRLEPNGNVQNLNLTANEIDALKAFLLTLTGSDLYTNEKWSDPFDNSGTIHLIGGLIKKEVSVYPNPASDHIKVVVPFTSGSVRIYNLNGELVSSSSEFHHMIEIELTGLSSGSYFVVVDDLYDQFLFQEKIIKR